MSDAADREHMARALRISVLGRHASPNPMVGCVLLDDQGRRVGLGWHIRPGALHAEAIALKLAAGCGAVPHTAYVTLEPCAHHGRTPPCADALIAAGVRRVVVAVLDPDPRVSGQGIDRMRAAGIVVEVGLLADRVTDVLAPYLKHRSTGLPWVTLKSAMTLDGKIATAGGDSRWISSAVSRAAVHRLRDRADAILTGVGTVLADDPQLTVRLPHRDARAPWRIVVDSRLRTAPGTRIVRQAAEDGRTMLITTAAADPKARETLERLGCQVVQCEADSRGRVSLPALMRYLGTRGDVVGVLAETGAALAAELMREKLVDRWLLYIAPKVAGGDDAPGPVGGEGVPRMADSLPIRFKKVRRSGPDLVVDGRLW